MIKSSLRSSLRWLADWQLVPVGILSPVLIFPDRFRPEMVALALLAIPALWVLHRLARGRFFTATPLDIPILLLLATLPVGWWAAAQPELALPHLIRYLIAVALFYALVNTFAAAGAGRVALAGAGMLAGTALVAVLSALGMASSGAKFLPAGLPQSIPRLISAFWNPRGFHPNIVGGFLAMSVPVTAAYAWAGRGWARRLLFGLLLAGEVFVLILTQSRGGILGFGVALLVVAVGRDRRWAWLALALAVVAVAGMALYGLQPTLDLVMGGGAGGLVRSAESRLELYSRGIYMLQDFPFTGIGLGMFPRVLPILYPLFLVDPSTEFGHVHNIYLQMGIDHGFPGLVAFLALVILLGVLGAQTVRQSRGRPWEPLAIGLVAGLAAYLTHGMVDAVGYSPRAHILLWGHFGLLVALWYSCKVCRMEGDSLPPHVPDVSHG
jgi:putative inorganic carbon (HCO3(-)) transporter